MIKYGMLLLLAACYVHTASPCACTREFAPQCASDGVTYANPCLLRCARARTGRQLPASPGPCRRRRDLRSPCACARNFAPVCASDGITYPNNCVLNCAKSKDEKLELAYPGKCQKESQEGCVCTFDYKPVCGSDGQTYSNPCMLGCAKRKEPSLRMVSDGKCVTARDKREASKPCICTMEYSPVLGRDGRTYPNRCAAGCAGQLPGGA